MQEFCYFFSEDTKVSEIQRYDADSHRPPYYGTAENKAAIYECDGTITPVFSFEERPDVEELRLIATDFYKKARAYPFLFILISSDEPEPRYAVIMTGGL